MTSSLYYSERTKKILKVTLLGSVSNITLVILKLIVGILGHSSALIAEAINSISDFTTDLIDSFSSVSRVSPRMRIITTDMGSMRP